MGRRLSPTSASAPASGSDLDSSFPILLASDYYTEPSLPELAAREAADPGYCARVPNFVVGRVGFGRIRFFGDTDVRCIPLDEIVKFGRHFASVYEDEAIKPPTGHRLNKAAEVTLLLQMSSPALQSLQSEGLVNKLRNSASRQGARFLSFDSSNGEWKFSVDHFSRFGLGDDDEEDVAMDDAVAQPAAEEKEPQMNAYGGFELLHSLPAHLGLDPMRMQEMRMLMFSDEENDEIIDDRFAPTRKYLGREEMKLGSPYTNAKSSTAQSPLQASSRMISNKASPSTGKAPQALLEYNVSSDVAPPKTILMTGQAKSPPVRMSKIEGFKLEEHSSAISSKKYSNCVVDAGLFMGRSFRVGWGPNGILVHTGSPVRNPGRGLSSIIIVEKVAADKAVRNERNKIKDELVDLCFSCPMNIHKSLDHKCREIEVGSYKLKLQNVVTRCTMLPEICGAYIEIIERQLEVGDLSASSRVLLMHQVTVWELIKVLFSERETGKQLKPTIDDDEDGMILDKKDVSLDIDPETLPLVRRADFSNWLQESVYHRVQGDVSCLSDARYLEHILLLLTGRQLDAATELAASRGDVRLAILVSQAGGSMINRSDMGQQLELWRINGMDFNLIEKDRLRIYELLAGDIHGAVQDSSIDWKRYLGLIMWYQLPPDTPLPIIIHTYRQLLSEGKVPFPVPVYIDEGPLDEALEWTPCDRFDISYYLMLLHADEEDRSCIIKRMFSAYSSLYDPLDYHMIWHQRSILEAIGAFRSIDLQVLDMSLVHQLLCLGQCHWAIYVIVHMPYPEEAPFVHEKIIREILLQYCEMWSKEEVQQQFLEDLGIPAAWMHEALATYSEYYGDRARALRHFIKCASWQKAHTIFMTSVAHSLFLSSKDSEIWEITSSMEEHKSEIADWDLGAGIYIDFYLLRSSMQEESIGDSDPLAKKNEECRNFFNRLNDSLLVWGSKIPVEARATYSKMAEQICSLLVSTPGENSTPDAQMSCFETMLGAPTPQDSRASRLQEAVSVFTYLLSEAAY